MIAKRVVKYLLLRFKSYPVKYYVKVWILIIFNCVYLESLNFLLEDNMMQFLLKAKISTLNPDFKFVIIIISIRDVHTVNQFNPEWKLLLLVKSMFKSYSDHWFMFIFGFDWLIFKGVILSITNHLDLFFILYFKVLVQVRVIKHFL